MKILSIALLIPALAAPLTFGSCGKAKQAPAEPTGVVVKVIPEVNSTTGRDKLFVRWDDGGQSIVYAAHGLCAVNDKVPDCTGN
jgi:hypothetical protein